MCIDLDKNGYSDIFFFYFPMKTCYGYSLEVYWRVSSNEYNNMCFHGEIRKISILFGEKKSILSRAMPVCKGRFCYVKLWFVYFCL